MRTITAAIAAVALLAGCGGGSEGTPATTGPAATTDSPTATASGEDTAAPTTNRSPTTPATAAAAEEGNQDDLLNRFKEYDEVFRDGDSAAVYDMYSAECRDKYSRGQYSTLVELAHVTIREFFDLEPTEVHNSEPEIDFAGSSAELTYDLLGPDDKPLMGDQSTTATWIFEDGEWVRDSCDFDEQLGIDSTDTTDGDATGPGSRDNPIPIGQAADVGDGWSLTINAVNLDADDAIAAADEINEPPADGTVYVLVNISATYNGEGSTTSGVGISAVGRGTNKAVVAGGMDGIAIAPDPMYDPLVEVFTSGTSEGNVVIEVPTEDIDTLVLIGQALTSFDETERKFFATS